MFMLHRSACLYGITLDTHIYNILLILKRLCMKMTGYRNLIVIYRSKSSMTDAMGPIHFNTASLKDFTNFMFLNIWYTELRNKVEIKISYIQCM